MKKTILVILVIVVLIGAVWATHLLEFYTISTTSNQPTYQPGHLVFASKFKKPGRGNFIVFENNKNNPFIFRVIAKAGDYVEIRNTAVYVNSKLLDEPYAYNEYFISNTDLKKIKDKVKANNNIIKPENDSTSVITATLPQAKSYNVPLQVRSLQAEHINPNILLEFRQWLYNEDNLGPIQVPENSYFVLGDNRHDAYDSRYIGFIRAEKVLSTVL